MIELQKLTDDELIEYFSLFVDMRAESHRAEDVKVEGQDFKFLYHVVRLISEVEQILSEGDLDLQRNNEQLKAIRRGDWTEQQIRDYFTAKEKDLETLYAESKLPYGPDKVKIKQLLLSCLEEHFGSLDKCIVNQDKSTLVLQEIKTLIEKANV